MAGVIVNQPEHLKTPLTATISHQNCKKIFVQRDYSEGNNVKFIARFPAELEGRIERDQVTMPYNFCFFTDGAVKKLESLSSICFGG